MKKQKLTRLINLLILESDYQALLKIREESKISTSQMFRNSLEFYFATYSSPKPTTNEN